MISTASHPDKKTPTARDSAERAPPDDHHLTVLH